MIGVLQKRKKRSRGPAVSRPNPQRRAELGQVMTPEAVACFMASLFTFERGSVARVLDSGAGMGALSEALVREWIEKTSMASPLFLTAYEVDPGMLSRLKPCLERRRRAVRQQGGNLNVTVLPHDFIQAVANPFEFGNPGVFTHAILNPPYKKISGDSMHRKWLRDAGVETVNLYSGFVALALQLLAPGGQLVAIVPRSFCNGPYYRSFRKGLLRNAALEQVHLFESRKEAFKADGVLQENVIIKLVRGARQGPVIISTSRDGSFADYQARAVRFEDVVAPDDAEKFIRIPWDEKKSGNPVPFHHTLGELGLRVSTGPVVDFRLKEFLSDETGSGMAPLLYPCHFADGELRWPAKLSKKKSAIRDSPETHRWLYPAGCYVLTRRLSSKEEPRRIVAHMITRSSLPGYEWIGFENHLNVFHMQKKGLEEVVARGLCVYLNSSWADQYFRDFNGHTQVNATDLKALPYPSAWQLEQLGTWAAQTPRLSQQQIDLLVERAHEN